MSDGEHRHDRDPAAQVADALRARLRSMEPQDLVELCAQLLTTYVVEGVLPLARAGEGAELASDQVGDESFAQLLKRLQAARKDPVLERFIVDGENISVRIEGQGVLPVTEYRRPASPPAPAGQPAPAPPRRESVPGASTSIYNRALYQPDEPVPQRAPLPAPAQRPAAPQPTPPTAAAPAASGQPKKDEPQKDRFTLIELE